MLGLVIALAVAATPTPPLATTPQELGLLLESIQPAQRAAVDEAVHRIGALPLYRVLVRIDPGTRAFHGQEQLRVPLTAPTSELPLRLFNDASYLNRGKPAVAVSGLTCPKQACKLAVDPEPTLLRVVFDPPLPAGSVAAIDLAFDGEVPALPASATTAQGQLASQMSLVQNHAKPSDHGAFGAGPNVVALTGLFPQLAPHFDGAPDLAAPNGVGDIASYDPSNYLVTVDVPSGFTALSAGAKVGDEATPDGDRRFTFAAAAVRDLPLYVGTWKTETETHAGVAVTAFTLSGDETNGKLALEIAGHALEEFSKRFGPYPWTTLSVVEQPLTDGAGGIEYPTVIGVASMLYRQERSLGPLGAMLGPQQKLGSHAPNVGFAQKTLELAVAHEVAHQWWSILVGSDPHRHPAVDESLAQYSAALYVESRRGKAAGDDALQNQVAINYHLMRAMGVADGAADRPTDSFDSPLQYSGLIYGKAPLFYRAVRKLLGERDFARALRAYADKDRFGEAGPADFVSSAAGISPHHARALRMLHEHWFEQAHGDDDLGQLDISKLVESVMGVRLSREERALFKQLGPQLMQMLQSGLDPSQLLQGVAPQGP